MGLSDKDIARLGENARRQIEAARKARARDTARREQIKSPPKLFDSKIEEDFYFAQVYPKLQSGEIVSCDLHRPFVLLAASEYCGVKLPSANYTPDFFLEYKTGYIEAVEVKHKVIRHLQRDYIYRRRLFIEIHARPKGWGFREIIIKD